MKRLHTVPITQDPNLKRCHLQLYSLCTHFRRTNTFSIAASWSISPENEGNRELNSMLLETWTTPDKLNGALFLFFYFKTSPLLM